jgi:uncharacterized membrane protein (DUF106 family)
MAYALGRLVGCALLLVVLAFNTPSGAEVLEAPVDPRERLNELDDAVVAKQRELFGARKRGDQAALERVTKEFEEIQKQRREVLKNSPHLFR